MQETTTAAMLQLIAQGGWCETTAILKEAMTTGFVRFYPLLLSQTYHYSQDTYLLLLAAAHALPPGTLQEHFAEHAREERGHEELILADLLALGWDGPAPCLPEVHRMRQHAWELVRGPCPQSFVGYTYTLELSAPTPETVAYALWQGVPREATQAITVHATSDARHRQQGHAILETLGAYQHDIVLAGVQTTVDLIQVGRGLRREYDGQLHTLQ